MDQNRAPHAALSQWQIESIGFRDTIYVAKNSQELFEQMKSSIISDMDLLIDHHYEAINCASLENVYEAFVGDDLPEDGWGAEDIRKLITKSIQEQSAHLQEFPDSPTILGRWYDIVEWINEWWDVWYDDYLRIPAEGSLVTFVHDVIDFFGPPMPRHKVIDFEEGKWIIELKHIVRSDRWWDNLEMLRAVRKLFHEFNKRYEFC